MTRRPSRSPLSKDHRYRAHETADVPVPVAVAARERMAEAAARLDATGALPDVLAMLGVAVLPTPPATPQPGQPTPIPMRHAHRSAERGRRL